MIGNGSIQVYAARVQPVMDRITARRLEHAASETQASRREGAAQSAQSPEAARANKEGVRAAALSFSTERALTGRLTAQSITEAGVAQLDRANGAGEKAPPSANDAKAAEGSKPSSSIELSDEEDAAVQELKARDREVRNHEQAHKAAGGRYAGAISYEYQKGPDGQQYAVGGEVAIDVSPEKDPEATIQKMNTVIAAALAPAEPSGQDKAVAQAAQALRNQALAQLSAQKRDEQNLLREGGDAIVNDDAPNAAAATQAAENIYDLLGTLINGAPESRFSAVA